MKLQNFLATASIWLLLSPSTAISAPAPPSAQQIFSESLAAVGRLFTADEREASVVSAVVTIAEGRDVPKEFLNKPFEIAFQAPGRLRAKGVINGETFEVGRNGQELWIWQPAKKFGLLGLPGIPRFTTRSNSVDRTPLEPLGLPFPPEQLALAPLLFRCESRPSEVIEGAPCYVIRAALAPEALALLRANPFTLNLAIRQSDSLPVRIGFSDGDKVDLTFLLSKLKVGATDSKDRWKLVAPPGARIEKVAVSHLKRFFPAAYSVLTTHVKTLGAPTGERKIVATHGQGRLEMHDGTRVLFLKGSPAEMGDQHGKLLKREVKDLTNRLLYGVGIASSFSKGSWFFGELEACQARIAKYMDPRYLREMDAMAKATGLDVEEIRLANFFPELFHCSGFALFGSATKGGHVYHGRVLDYMRGIGLERNAVIIVSKPDQGYGWVNVSYAGFVGSVTAMNEKGISMGEMGGRGEGQWDGKPMAQLVREVMEKAGTLEEAIAIMQKGPRTCEYFYVIADGPQRNAVGIAATPTTFEIIKPGVAHPRLPHAISNAVLMSAGDRYEELARRVQSNIGKFDATSSRELMTRPVCMTSNIHSVLFATDSLEFWVANADSKNVASDCRYTHYNLSELLKSLDSR